MGNEEVKFHKCPLCGSNEIFMHKIIENQMMDGYSYEWLIECDNCKLAGTRLPADHFYGRDCYETSDEAVMKWNEMCSKYD